MKKQPRPQIFTGLDQECDVAQFDFVSSSHGKGMETFIPFVISKVLDFDGMAAESGLTLKRRNNIPYKVLLPKMFGTRHSTTKLDPISLPVNGSLTLGRGEMLKKTDFDKRISRSGHLLIICSDIMDIPKEAET